MALKKTTTTTTTQTNFESDPEMTAVIDTPETQPDATVSATTAIAKAAATSLSSNDAALAAKNFKKEIEAMQDAADFSWGSMRQFKAMNGTIRESGGDKLDLGRWVKVQMLAWGRSWQITPGTDGKDSASFVAFSKDGKIIDHVIGEDQKSWEGRGVEEYLTYLQKEEEFDRAAKREFIDTQCAVLGSEEEPDFNEIVQITLSSSSIPAFRSYQTALEAKAKCVLMGLPNFKLPENPMQFYFLREAASKGSNSWTRLRIVTDLPAKI